MDLAPDHRTRKLRNQADVIAGVGFFADEIQRAYAGLGFRDPGFVRNGLRMFNWQPYFLARSAPMGTVSGEVVAATFGVFPLHRVLANVAEGLQLADYPTMLATRLEATTAAMTRILGAAHRALGGHYPSSGAPCCCLAGGKPQSRLRYASRSAFCCFDRASLGPMSPSLSGSAGPVLMLRVGYFASRWSL